MTAPEFFIELFRNRASGCPNIADGSNQSSKRIAEEMLLLTSQDDWAAAQCDPGTSFERGVAAALEVALPAIAEDREWIVERNRKIHHFASMRIWPAFTMTS